MLKRGFPSKRLISQVPAVSFPPGYWWQWAGARLAGSLRIRNKHQRLKVAPAHSGCSWPRQVCSNWLRKPQEISHSRYRYPKWPLCFWKNPLKLERYCWRKKSCTTWDVQNPRNRTFTISTGAGFLPSTVPFPNEPFFLVCHVKSMLNFQGADSWMWTNKSHCPGWFFEFSSGLGFEPHPFF